MDFIRTLTGFLGDVISVEGEHLRIHVFGEVAVLTGIQVARLVLPNGLQVTDTLALTNVFRQIDGEWRLALAHPVQLTAG